MQSMELGNDGQSYSVIMSLVVKESLLYVGFLAMCGESSGSLGVCVGGVTVPSLYGGDPFTYQLQSDHGMLAHSIREALVLRNLRNSLLSEDTCSSLYIYVSAVYTWNCILSLHKWVTVVGIVSIREGLKGGVGMKCIQVLVICRQSSVNACGFYLRISTTNCASSLYSCKY